MSSTEYFCATSATVAAQFARAGLTPWPAGCGPQKDVVIANRLANAPGRVAIYGWHRSNGDLIQPLSTVHGEYCTPITAMACGWSRARLMSSGRAVDLRGLLTDGQYAGPAQQRRAAQQHDGQVGRTSVANAAEKLQFFQPEKLQFSDPLTPHRGSSESPVGSSGGCPPNITRLPCQKVHAKRDQCSCARIC